MPTLEWSLMLAGGGIIAAQAASYASLKAGQVEHARRLLQMEKKLGIDSNGESVVMMRHECDLIHSQHKAETARINERLYDIEKQANE
jgi:hypothetical protein